MDFGDAIRALKEGCTVAREGWNGKGMWLALSPGHPSLSAQKFWAGPNRDYAEANGGHAPVLPCITMKTATGEILMGWLASQTDMLAEDWVIVGAPTPAGINHAPAAYWNSQAGKDVPVPLQDGEAFPGQKAMKEALPRPTQEQLVAQAVENMLQLANTGALGGWPEKPVDVLVAVCTKRLRTLAMPVPDDLRQVCNDALMTALMKG